MNSTFLLRVLLVVAVLLAIAAGALDTAYPEPVPAHAREAFRGLLPSRDVPRGSAFLALAAVYELLLAAVIGMMRLRRWGFHLGHAVTAIPKVQARLLSPHAYSGIALSALHRHFAAEGKSRCTPSS